MRTCLILASIFLSALTATAAEPSAPPVKLDLFLLVGQSNMAGRGHVEPQDKVVDPKVWMLTEADAWAPAIDPMHFDKPKAVGVGPGRTFGIAVAARSGSAVGLVPCAVGGTSINQWKKGGKLYADAIARARAAMARGTFRAVVWHQGETDLDHKMSAEEYFPKLATLIADFRADLNAPEIPFILGQVGPFYAKKESATASFNAKLMEFAGTQSRCACASSEGLRDIGDSTHFDAASQREFGRRYAAEYENLIAPTH